MQVVDKLNYASDTYIYSDTNSKYFLCLLRARFPNSGKRRKWCKCVRVQQK